MRGSNPTAQRALWYVRRALPLCRVTDTLRGSLVYNHLSDSYFLSQTVLETGASSSQTVQCQAGKKYVVPYVVYEKTFPCASYPPDGSVTFHNITMECETDKAARVDCKSMAQWSARVMDDNCEMRAHIDSPDQIRITWDTSMTSKYDNHSHAQLEALNTRRPDWAKRVLAKRAPLVEEKVGA